MFKHHLYIEQHALARKCWFAIANKCPFYGKDITKVLVQFFIALACSYQWQTKIYKQRHRLVMFAQLCHV
jgi:hypothetical protein